MGVDFQVLVSIRSYQTNCYVHIRPMQTSASRVRDQGSGESGARGQGSSIEMLDRGAGAGAGASARARLWLGYG